jgi:uncharacterized membrane protein YdjX (TVP38/TMEM64 family)
MPPTVEALQPRTPWVPAALVSRRILIVSVAAPIPPATHLIGLGGILFGLGSADHPCSHNTTVNK